MEILRDDLREKLELLLEQADYAEGLLRALSLEADSIAGSIKNLTYQVESIKSELAGVLFPAKTSVDKAQRKLTEFPLETVY